MMMENRCQNDSGLISSFCSSKWDWIKSLVCKTSAFRVVLQWFCGAQTPIPIRWREVTLKSLIFNEKQKVLVIIIFPNIIRRLFSQPPFCFPRIKRNSIQNIFTSKFGLSLHWKYSTLAEKKKQVNSVIRILWHLVGIEEANPDKDQLK